MSSTSSPEALTRAILDERHYSYTLAASCTWLGYDILLTFPQELAIVWRRRWSIAKCLYVIVRYYSIVCVILYLTVVTNSKISDQKFCQRWAIFYSIGPIIAPFSVDSLIIIRLYALYDRRKSILVLLLLLWIAQAVAIIFVDNELLRGEHGIARPPGFAYQGCLLTSPGNIRRSLVAWVINLTCQLAYFFLLLYKYIQSVLMFRDRSNQQTVVQIVKHTRDFSPLISLFFRDGSASFLLLFAAMLVNTIFTLVASGPYEQMGVPWLMVTNAIIGGRLFLNLGGYLYRAPPSSPDAFDVNLKISNGSSHTRRSTLSENSQSTGQSDTLPPLLNVAVPPEVAYIPRQTGALRHISDRRNSSTSGLSMLAPSMLAPPLPSASNPTGLLSRPRMSHGSSDFVIHSNRSSSC